MQKQQRHVGRYSSKWLVHRPDIYKQRGLTKMTSGLCYNIRHFERHRRELEDPWSCRQSAIHQKYYFETRRSSWLVIQPPILFASSWKDRKVSCTSHPMDLHIRYLASGTGSWREYLNYIAERLKIFVSSILLYL
jgi:hypothetical protein